MEQKSVISAPVALSSTPRAGKRSSVHRAATPSVTLLWLRVPTAPFSRAIWALFPMGEPWLIRVSSATRHTWTRCLADATEQPSNYPTKLTLMNQVSE